VSLTSDFTLKGDWFGASLEETLHRAIPMAAARAGEDVLYLVLASSHQDLFVLIFVN